MPRKSASSRLTVGDFLDTVAPGVTKREVPPLWPPDVFALSASLLQRSGAYTLVVQKKLGGTDWPAEMRAVAQKWRRSFSSEVPDEVLKWWTTLLAAKNTAVDELSSQQRPVIALLKLMCAADEASTGIGLVAPFGGNDDAFESAWADLMEDQGRTCCIEIDPDRIVVLPKLHTPRSGMTLRSLSHNLALYQPGEVVPQWHNLPTFDDHEGLRLLLLPWPLTLGPDCILEAGGTNISMPERFGFFTCDLRKDGKAIVDAVKIALAAAEKNRGPVDAIVFPEGCLIGDEYTEISRETRKLVIAGVARVAKDDQPGVNEAAVAIPAGTFQLTWKQSKHHRWRIDASQIEQYGLSLDPERDWWEDIRLDKRRINFLSMNDWLTLAVLICEDLARLDPVADLIRSVGPSLVVSLLLDGPQLPTRWPARYATVLADDPGSSVLTLTSAGMAKLSKPPANSPAAKKNAKGRTVIALWKDAKNAAIPIELNHDSVGVVLDLRREFCEEWSADGRGDGKTTAYLLCNGYEQVKAKGIR